MEVVNFSEVFLRQHGGQDHWIFPSFVTSEAKHSTIDRQYKKEPWVLLPAVNLRPSSNFFFLCINPHTKLLLYCESGFQEEGEARALCNSTRLLPGSGCQHQACHVPRCLIMLRKPMDAQDAVSDALEATWRG